ncbi:RdgB/HAM1 family non-canonical purine NTP pyrophosphatase [Methylocystis heyeri]|uniref:dITP/XTP pyrophosphatase n=1 Tax=Methylocystis heyeri TaxID=391905 RepID=A0A6B8KAE4_9HYPH|nr:RdgB/HAM1 family non-canonical purine NTP pyrophosphatase [Methylocystis heyeri]QGM44707.1 RdgB/HAM1 family non-canonical purine NTP pyrophosphatase [Methylocystis heyeri]
MSARKIEGRLVIASHNPGKLWELQQLLGPHGVDAVSAGELGLAEPDETETTFRGNALLKAKAAAEAAQLPAFADDSGLCVDALDGAPGVYSARWGGENRDFAAAIARVERELKEREAEPPFAAHFICALAIVWPDGHVEEFEGRVDGVLLFPPRGTKGFGYDPIFLPDGLDKTFGEMMSAEKHAMPDDGSIALSHRARAFQALAKACLAD